MDKTTIHPPHGNQLGEKPRVRLCGGPFVDQSTLDFLKAVQTRGTSFGITIDRLARHAILTGFDPVSNSYVSTLKKKNRADPKA